MKLDWRKSVIYATLIIMEGSWLYASLALLNRKAAGESLSVWGLLLVYLLSFASTKALRFLRWHRFFTGCISWLLWVAVMLLTVKSQLFPDTGLADTAWLLSFPGALGQIFYGVQPALLVLVSTGVLWWLGRRLAHSGTGFVIAVAEFQFGLVILIIVYFIASQYGVAYSDSVATALVFFSSGLIGISIAHAQESRSWLSSWSRSASGGWPGLLVLSIGLILVFGLLISIIVTPDLLNLIIEGLKWLWTMIERALVFLASLLPPPEPAQPLPTMPAIPGEGSPEEYRLFQIPEFLLNGLRLAWTIVVLGVVLFAIWRISSQIFGWLRRRMVSQGGEVEPLSGAFQADLLGWLKRILFKLLGLRLRLKPEGLPVPPEAATVRQVYSQLLQWAKTAGHPRLRYQTPDEYRYVLEGLLPGNAGELDFITRQYVGARYGPYLPSEDELRRLKQSWRTVRQSRFKEPDDKGHQKSG